MLWQALDNRIRSAFSDAAMRYEVLAGLQRAIGRELVGQVLDQEEYQCILDVGMGTGRLTNRLKMFFPQAQVIGMDFAPGMIEQARIKYDSFHIVMGDAARLPFKPGCFDLVVSNLVYQWLDNLEEAFKLNYSVLADRGECVFTLFGERTLQELFFSLEWAWRQGSKTAKGQTLPAGRLPSYERVMTAVRQAGFAEVQARRELITTHFPDMMALLKWVKETGANGIRKDFFAGRDCLAAANAYYQEHYQDRWGVCASFEVLWFRAFKKRGQTIGTETQIYSA
jgi:malonyl-CoA O-methyltransferase